MLLIAHNYVHLYYFFLAITGNLKHPPGEYHGSEKPRTNKKDSI